MLGWLLLLLLAIALPPADCRKTKRQKAKAAGLRTPRTLCCTVSLQLAGIMDRTTVVYS